ncbi:MAG: hypothetical protein AB1599_00665 [Planctomycetota bacterium]
MSGIIIIALLLTCAVCLLLVAIPAVIMFVKIKKLSNWIRIPIIITACIISICSFPFILFGLTSWLGQMTTSYAFNVTVQEANKKCYPDMPLEAIDVNYFTSAGGLNLLYDCQVTEQVFLSWMEKRGWKPVRFITKENNKTVWADEKLPFPKFRGLGISSVDNGPRYTWPPFSVKVYSTKLYAQYWQNNYSGTKYEITIKNGYYFDDYDTEAFDDSGFTVVYDIDAGRLYLCSTRF